LAGPAAGRTTPPAPPGDTRRSAGRDTGNPVFSDPGLGDPPCPRRTPWNCGGRIKPFIAYRRIKEGRHRADIDELFPLAEYTGAGAGGADVTRTIADFLKSGYEAICHSSRACTRWARDRDRRPQKFRRQQTRLQYGRRRIRLVARQPAGNGDAPLIGTAAHPSPPRARNDGWRSPVVDKPGRRITIQQYLNKI
jgi:hypothetical protein